MSDDKQDKAWGVMPLDTETRGPEGGPCIFYRGITGKANGNFNHSEIHTGPQALMDAVVDELGEQVSLECLLVALKGNLRYDLAGSDGEYFITSSNFPVLDRIVCGWGVGSRLVFTPPAPKDTLAERARKLQRSAPKHGGAVGWLDELVELVGEVAEKLEAKED